MNLLLQKLVALTADNVTVHSAEHNKNYTLPTRADAVVGSCVIHDNRRQCSDMGNIS